MPEYMSMSRVSVKKAEEDEVSSSSSILDNSNVSMSQESKESTKRIGVCCASTCCIVMVVFLVVALLPGGSQMYTEEGTLTFDTAYAQDLLPKWENRHKYQTWTLQTKITIRQPRQKVFDAVMTANMWPVCYPNTLSVGGLSHVPFSPDTPKGMVLERFLWAGSLYSLFRYQVADYEPPKFATFDGDIIYSVLDLFDTVLPASGGRFQYNLTAISADKTEWTRTVYFYLDGSAGLFQKALFYMSMSMVIFPGQVRGAPVYVNCVKRFLESPGWEKELWQSRDGEGEKIGKQKEIIEPKGTDSE